MRMEVMVTMMVAVMLMMFVFGFSGCPAQTQADGQSHGENDFAHEELPLLLAEQALHQAARFAHIHLAGVLCL